MKPTDEITHLLREIRDLQQAHLDAYREVTARSLAMQQQADGRQVHFARVHRIALAVGSVLIVGIVTLILYLLSWL